MTQPVSAPKHDHAVADTLQGTPTHPASGYP